MVSAITAYLKRSIVLIMTTSTYLLDPESYPSQCENLVNGLNRHQPKCNQSEWLKIFRAWKDIVRY